MLSRGAHFSASPGRPPETARPRKPVTAAALACSTLCVPIISLMSIEEIPGVVRIRIKTHLGSANEVGVHVIGGDCCAQIRVGFGADEDARGVECPSVLTDTVANCVAVNQNVSIQRVVAAALNGDSSSVSEARTGADGRVRAATSGAGAELADAVVGNLGIDGTAGGAGVRHVNENAGLLRVGYRVAVNDDGAGNVGRVVNEDENRIEGAEAAHRATGAIAGAGADVVDVVALNGRAERVRPLRNAN